jgi:hypothetical protein
MAPVEVQDRAVRRRVAVATGLIAPREAVNGSNMRNAKRLRA